MLVSNMGLREERSGEGDQQVGRVDVGVDGGGRVEGRGHGLVRILQTAENGSYSSG